MALTGTLADIAVVELIQLPHSGHKSGTLRMVNRQGEARLYYDNGKLVHCESNGDRGIDTLVEVLGWSEADFEFRQGETTKEQTIDAVFHQILMDALRLRDERAAEQRVPPAAEGGAELGRVLDAFVAEQQSVGYACVVAADGSVDAEACRADDERGCEPLQALAALVSGFPHKGLARVLAQDTAGTVVLLGLPGDRAVLVAAELAVPLGAVSMAGNKLAATLAGNEP